VVLQVPLNVELGADLNQFPNKGAHKGNGLSEKGVAAGLFASCRTT
jgi:hypothetical protein